MQMSREDLTVKSHPRYINERRINSYALFSIEQNQNREINVPKFLQYVIFRQCEYMKKKLQKAAEERIFVWATYTELTIDTSIYQVDLIQIQYIIFSTLPTDNDDNYNKRRQH